MEETNPSGILAQLSSQKIKIDLLFVILISLLLLLKNYGVGVPNGVFMASLAGYALFCFIATYFVMDLDGFISLIVSKVLFIASAIVTLALLLRTVGNQGYTAMAQIAITALVIAWPLLLRAFFMSKSKQHVAVRNTYLYLIARGLFFLLVGICLLYY